jgi:hypothetical protein
MFKYLLLKTIYTVSDVDVVERSQYDMSFKYFLGMSPEEGGIDPSSLTKFRKLWLKDTRGCLLTGSYYQLINDDYRVLHSADAYKRTCATLLSQLEARNEIMQIENRIEEVLC